jgi:starvation-inducible DNA-binding protein
MIAERVLTLGGTHTFEDYIKHNKIVVGKNQMMKKQFNLLYCYYLLILERAILDKSA